MNDEVFEPAGSRVLVTGATGLIGGAVARRLLADGAHVRGLVRRREDAERLRAAGIEPAPGDVTDARALARAADGCDAVAHFAGFLSRTAAPWPAYLSVNVEGTRCVLRAALDAGVGRFLHASSAWSYGFGAGPGTDERAPAHACGDPYCDTKLLGQRIVLDAARNGLVSAVVIQPVQVYGPGDRTWTGLPLRLLRNRTMVVPAPDGGRMQPIFIADVVEGAVAALRRGGSGECYLLCGAEEVSAREYFERLMALGTRQRRLVALPRGLLLAVAAASGPLRAVAPDAPLITKTAVRGTSMAGTFSGAKARDELGFTPRVGLDEGMAAVREWAVRERLL